MADLPVVLTVRGAADALTISRSTLLRLVRRGDFPEPIRLSPGRVGFLAADVQAWLEKRVRILAAAQCS